MTEKYKPNLDDQLDGWGHFNSGSEAVARDAKKQFNAGLFLAMMLVFMGTSIDDLFEKRRIFQEITDESDDIDIEDVPVD